MQRRSDLHSHYTHLLLSFYSKKNSISEFIPLCSVYGLEKKLHYPDLVFVPPFINCLFFLGPCNPNPCQNFGSCEEDRSDFKCTCLDPYSGKLCEKGKIDVKIKQL